MGAYHDIVLRDTREEQNSLHYSKTESRGGGDSESSSMRMNDITKDILAVR